MSISAFFHQESPRHPYFNTIPNSYNLPQTSWNKQDSNLDMTYQGTSPYPSFDRNLNESVLPTFHSSRDQEKSSPTKNAPIPSIPSSSVQESGYSSVIIPNTIDDFLATHQAILLSGFESDFSIDFVELLCIQEPHKCGHLLDTLKERASFSDNFTTSKPDEKAFKLKNKSAIEVPHSSLSDRIDLNPLPLIGLPRHALLLVFLPFFPVMLLFTASGGLAFFVTSIVEFFASLILGDVRDVTFGRVWVGFTFLFFSPVIYFIITLFIDLVTSALDL